MVNLNGDGGHQVNTIHHQEGNDNCQMSKMEVATDQKLLGDVRSEQDGAHALVVVGATGVVLGIAPEQVLHGAVARWVPQETLQLVDLGQGHPGFRREPAVHHKDAVFDHGGQGERRKQVLAHVEQLLVVLGDTLRLEAHVHVLVLRPPTDGKTRMRMKPQEEQVKDCAKKVGKNGTRTYLLQLKIDPQWLVGVVRMFVDAWKHARGADHIQHDS